MPNTERRSSLPPAVFPISAFRLPNSYYLPPSTLCHIPNTECRTPNAGCLCPMPFFPTLSRLSSSKAAFRLPNSYYLLPLIIFQMHCAERRIPKAEYRFLASIEYPVSSIQYPASSYSFGFSFSARVSPKTLKHSTVRARARPG